MYEHSLNVSVVGNPAIRTLVSALDDLDDLDNLDILIPSYGLVKNAWTMAVRLLSEFAIKSSVPVMVGDVIDCSALSWADEKIEENAWFDPVPFLETLSVDNLVLVVFKRTILSSDDVELGCLAYKCIDQPIDPQTIHKITLGEWAEL